MGIYIKNIKKPWRCDECMFTNSADECIFLNTDADIDGLNIDCLIIEVSDRKTEQTEIKGSKRLVKGSEEETEAERIDRIDNEIEDAWARIKELTPQPNSSEKPNNSDCEACELDGKADVCKICRVSNYEPQTDCAWK